MRASATQTHTVKLQEATELSRQAEVPHRHRSSVAHAREAKPRQPQKRAHHRAAAVEAMPDRTMARTPPSEQQWPAAESGAHSRAAPLGQGTSASSSSSTPEASTPHYPRHRDGQNAPEELRTRTTEPPEKATLSSSAKGTTESVPFRRATRSPPPLELPTPEVPSMLPMRDAHAAAAPELPVATVVVAPPTAPLPLATGESPPPVASTCPRCHAQLVTPGLMTRRGTVENGVCLLRVNELIGASRVV